MIVMGDPSTCNTWAASKWSARKQSGLAGAGLGKGMRLDGDNSMISQYRTATRIVDASGREKAAMQSATRSGALAAYFSPMPPEASGISDYSAELLAPLSQRLELDIYTQTVMRGAFGEHVIYPYGEYPPRRQYQQYALNVYAMGNHPAYHDDIFDLALPHPGLVVMHYLSLYDSYRLGFCALRALLAAEVEYAHGAEARKRWLGLAQSPSPVAHAELTLRRPSAPRRQPPLPPSE